MGTLRTNRILLRFQGQGTHRKVQIESFLYFVLDKYALEPLIHNLKICTHYPRLHAGNLA